MDLGLLNKVALVTGGSHGIGLATARALTAEGCWVAICSRDHGQRQAAINSFSVGDGNVRGYACNATDYEAIRRTVEGVIADWGRLDILINNVGGGGRWGREDPLETPESVWDQVNDKNARAAMRFTLLALPHMLERQWGRVVTVSSVHGREAGGRPWFTMTKAAEIALMKAMSQIPKYARAGITFNTVAPGECFIAGTATAGDAVREPGLFEARMQRLPLGRLGNAEEVADVIALLCSRQASWVNGACLSVDGGEGRSF